LFVSGDGLIAGRWIFPDCGAQRPIRAASGRFSLNRRRQKNPMLSHEVSLFV
jgi:hypothetical protein